MWELVLTVTLAIANPLYITKDECNMALIEYKKIDNHCHCRFNPKLSPESSLNKNGQIYYIKEE